MGLVNHFEAIQKTEEEYYRDANGCLMIKGTLRPNGTRRKDRKVNENYLRSVKNPTYVAPALRFSKIDKIEKNEDSWKDKPFFLRNPDDCICSRNYFFKNRQIFTIILAIVIQHLCKSFLHNFLQNFFEKIMQKL